MSIDTKRLNRLIDEQQSILNSIKSEAMSINSDEINQQNERLKSELEQSEKTATALKTENESLKKELSTTKTALFAKMANEKLLVFNSTQKRLEGIYYASDVNATNKLNDYENKCRKSIDATIKAIEGYGSKEFDDILLQLKALQQEASDRRAMLETYKNEEIEKASSVNFEIGNKLKNEPLTEAEQRTALKQKSLESFIGLNILGKAGILLFIIGIIMLGRFAYVHMSDVFKGVIIYLLGIVLVGVGEIFHKKEKTVFSTTLISGGVATLYAATATCYFAFNLYNEKITFILCILITAIAILLTNQVKSQVVCGFASVGGYLPVVALYLIGFGKAASDITFLPISSVYFCLLAVVLFVMTYNKKWYIAQFIGYGLHLISIGGIAKCAYSLKDLPGYEYALPLAVAFSVASFAIYLMMPSTKIIKRKPMLVGDSVLLGLNTLSGAISVSITVHNCLNDTDKSNRVVGFVFLAFAIIYAILTVFSVREKKQGSGIATTITSIGALIFSMLVIPLAFGIEYAGISWSVEGVIIALISVEKRLKLPEIAGVLCMICSIICTIFCELDTYSVLSIITFSVILASFWIYTVRGLIDKKENNASALPYIIFELLTAYATAGFVFYLYSCILNSPSISVYSSFANCSVAITAILLVSIIIRHGILKNDLSVVVSDIVGIILMLITFALTDITNKYNETFSYFNAAMVESKGICTVNLIILILINIFVELFFAHCVLDIINRMKLPAWIYTMAISVSSLMLTTATIMVQFDISFNNIIISAMYIAVACILLVIGFKKQYTIIRSGGLVLILIAFAKLCFIDTSHLDSSWKIAAYFAFGAILIVISYFYQRFSKKLESDAIKLVEKQCEENTNS